MNLRQQFLASVSFVGRHAELSLLHELADAGTALTTVFGPPGVGKSALVGEFVASTNDPSWIWIDLTSTGDVADLLGQMAQRFDVVGDSAIDRTSAIGRAVRARGAMRIVLDGARTVTGALADTIQGLVDTAPDAQWIFVSTSTLGILGEQTLEVRPFDAERNSDTCAPIESLSFWEMCVRRVIPDYQTKLDDRSALDALLRKLEGLPLAIESTAALRKEFSVADLLTRMNRRLEILDDRPSGRIEWVAGRPVIAAFREACDVLSVEERGAFFRLAVIPGRFGIEEAEAAIDSPDPNRALALVAALREKSILASTTTEPYRLFFYDAFRVLAEDEITSNLRSQVVKRVAAHCAKEASREAARVATRNEPLSVTWIQDREALFTFLVDTLLPSGLLSTDTQSADASSGVENALTLLASLASIAVTLRNPSTYEALVTRLLSEIGGGTIDNLDGDAIALCRTALASYAFARGELSNAVTFAEAALAIESAKSFARAKALYLIGRVHYVELEFDRARARFDQAVSTSEGTAGSSVYVVARAWMDVLTKGGDSFAIVEQAVSDALPHAGESERGDLLWSLTQAASAVGHFDLAESTALAALECFQRTGQVRPQGMALTVLARGALARGDVDGALANGRAALEAFRQTTRDGASDLTLWATAQQYAYFLICTSRPTEAKRVISEYATTESYSRVAWQEWNLALIQGLLGDFQGAREQMRSIDMSRLAVPTARQVMECRAVWLDIWEAEAHPHDLARRASVKEKVAGALETVQHIFNPDTLLDRVLLAARVSATSNVPVPSEQWIFDSNGSAFQQPNGSWVDLTGAHVLSATIKLLLDLRAEAPGQYLPSRDLIDTLWPGDRSSKHHRINRFSVHLNRLRRLGIAPILEKQGTGYRLSPSASIQLRRAIDVQASNS